MTNKPECPICKSSSRVHKVNTARKVCASAGAVGGACLGFAAGYAGAKGASELAAHFGFKNTVFTFAGWNIPAIAAGLTAAGLAGILMSTMTGAGAGAFSGATAGQQIDDALELSEHYCRRCRAKFE